MADSSSTSPSEWDLVGSGLPPQAEVGASSDDFSGYAQVASSLSRAPQSCIELCARVGSSPEEARSRAQRAWEAGLWAKAVVEGKVPTPRPTPKLPGYRNSCYVVLRAPGLEHPVRVASAAKYFQLLPTFEGSLSHAFPSVAEARVYCSGFGIAFPSEQ